LSVALSTVRSVLDPGGAREPDHYLVADRDAARINLDHLTVDVETFLASAREALSEVSARGLEPARTLLEVAESGYPGDFLDEDLYEDWAAPVREEARALYVAVARSLAGLARGAGDLDASIRYWLRVIEHDPYDEEAHLQLVATLDGAGRRGEARRQYGLYTARMAELGVEPAPFLTPAPA
jgi:DNA-binding SARP family transcriptional activator